LEPPSEGSNPSSPAKQVKASEFAFLGAEVIVVSIFARRIVRYSVSMGRIITSAARKCAALTVVIALFASTVPRASAAANPIMHLRFDEGTGTVLQDSTSNNIDGAFMTPNPTWSSDVPSVSFTNPYSLQFSGLGDGVSIAWPSGQNFTSTEPRSYSFWYKPLGDEENDATSHYNRILSCTSDSCEFAGTFGDISVHRLAFYDGAWRDTGFNMTVGVWYNITFTYDGSVVKLYVAGEEEFSDTSSGRAMSGTMYVGVRHTGDEGINGRVDDLRVYDFALSPTQVDNIVAGSDNPDSPPSSNNSSAASGGGANMPVWLLNLRQRNNLSPHGAAMPVATTYSSSAGASSSASSAAAADAAPPDVSSSASSSSSSSSANSSMSPVQERVCSRVMKRTLANSLRLKSINQRLQKWLGFTCRA
jgi:hypothetical protein